MRIEQIMARPVQCRQPQDTLAQASTLMWHHDCGCLPARSGDGVGRVEVGDTLAAICEPQHRQLAA